MSLTATAPLVNPAGAQHPVAVSLNAIIDELAIYFQERRPVIQAMVLAVLAKHHVIILGPPGTAKSMLTRALFARILRAAYFEALLSKTRPAEAILGPYDIPELRDSGSLHRKIGGFLPTANFAMLDEFGKMSPTLGHDMLAVILERRLHQVNGGRSWIDCPLYTFIGGTNELPTEESDDAAALWDRVLVRTTVDNIQESSNFATMLTNTADPTRGTTVEFTDLADAVDSVVPATQIPTDVVELVVRLRDDLRGQHDIVLSDRRWRQSMDLLKASAFLNGRTAVTDDDIQVLRYTLWELPSQINTVERATLAVSNPIAEAALKLLEDIECIAAGIRDRKGQSLESMAKFGAESNGKLKIIQSELGQKKQECLAAGRSTIKLDEVGDRIKTVQRSIFIDCLGMDPDTVP